jgi:hypothetical protein
MATGYQELFLEKGATFNVTITLDAVNNVPFDLTGYSANSQIRTSYYSSNAIATFTTSIGDDPVKGRVTLSLTYQQTANIAPGRYLYDIYISNNSDTWRSRVVEGIVNVTPSVTVF